MSKKKKSRKNKKPGKNFNRRKKNRQLIAKLKDNPCKDCHLKFPPWILQFDHLPGHQKLYEVNRACQDGGAKAILREVAKCDLVCATCHKARTYARGQFNYGIREKTKETKCSLCQRECLSLLLEIFEEPKTEKQIIVCANCNLKEKERYRMGAFGRGNYYPERFKNGNAEMFRKDGKS